MWVGIVKQKFWWTWHHVMRVGQRQTKFLCTWHHVLMRVDLVTKTIHKLTINEWKKQGRTKLCRVIVVGWLFAVLLSVKGVGCNLLILENCVDECRDIAEMLQFGERFSVLQRITLFGWCQRVQAACTCRWHQLLQDRCHVGNDGFQEVRSCPLPRWLSC